MLKAIRCSVKRPIQPALVNCTTRPSGNCAELGSAHETARMPLAVYGLAWSPRAL
jgi:hypothetical protein